MSVRLARHGVVSVVLTVAALAGPTADRCGWEVPVDAPVVDEFRPPDEPYGPGGNRGIEYGTVGGETVGAVDGGEVSFAGPVGGRGWVVVEHRSGLRSTYGPLEGTAVGRGDRVATGQLLGTAGAGLHLTARTASAYIDPAPLLAGACGRARLVNPSTVGPRETRRYTGGPSNTSHMH